MRRTGRRYPAPRRRIRRIHVKRFGKFYEKKLFGTKMMSPRIRKFARKHGLKPSRSLRRGGYGTYYAGDRYLTYNKGKLKIRRRVY